MIKKELDFVVFCVENIAQRLNLSGDKVYDMLAVNSKILDDYVIPNYEVLHTQDKEYIVNDIVEYMKKEGLLL